MSTPWRDGQPAQSPRWGGAWARGGGVTLAPFSGALDAGLERALRDGVERGYEGPIPAAPPHATCMVVRAVGERVGLLVFAAGVPGPGAATVHAIAIDPDRRGNDYGTRALLAMERWLRREGVATFYGRVPRGNGRGLYFMLRAGYSPVTPPVVDGASWFLRSAEPPGK
ncbi:MAG: GNAT family N-acetyltransferase [Dehalococcoidia bacterium]|nr:GNAT family N-acetyltransferase [Dehalococcoidia bacterium]